MNFIMKYGIAYVMDLIFGDPHWFPHPVRIIGVFINFLEKILYKASNKKVSGAFLTIIVVGVTFIVSYYISAISYIFFISKFSLNIFSSLSNSCSLYSSKVIPASIFSKPFFSLILFSIFLVTSSLSNIP